MCTEYENGFGDLNRRQSLREVLCLRVTLDWNVRLKRIPILTGIKTADVFVTDLTRRRHSDQDKQGSQKSSHLDCSQLPS